MDVLAMRTCPGEGLSLLLESYFCPWVFGQLLDALQLFNHVFRHETVIQIVLHPGKLSL